MPRAQGKRELAISTPLADDALLLARFEGTEELGRLFEYELELLADSAEIKFEDLVGQNVTIRVETPGGDTRYINGHIRRFVQTGFEPGAATYEALVVPFLWLLTRTSDCRIFQNKSVPDIVKEVIKAHGFSDLKDSLSGSYPAREYCVQYRETDFDFVSRLLEDEGIYYYFEHANGKHTMVLADSPAAHSPAQGAEEVRFHLHSEGELSGEFVYEWSIEKTTLPGRVSLNDFDFVKPASVLESKSSGAREHAAANFEMYDYEGGYVTTAEGERYAKIRLEEWQCAYEQVEGETDVRELCVGHTFKLADHPRADQNREYLITAAEFSAAVEDYSTDPAGKEEKAETDEDEDEEPYECTFTAIPASQPFRPDRTTPHPYIRGPQTGIVVGKSGEEIWTDEHGRVMVQFHWDRASSGDEKCSCWVRVAQSVAGKKWGGMFLPRIGQEVIIEFLEGDPDRPLVTGGVYNGANKTPYPFPDNATMSGIKTSSSKGSDGFNELRFEDKKGDEQVFIHAQKDMHVKVLNDHVSAVDANEDLTVGGNQKVKIGGDRDETVEGKHKELIKGESGLEVQGNESTKVGGTLSLVVTDKAALEFQADYAVKVAGEAFVKADKVIIEGASHITIKVGDSYIAIESSGITIGTSGTIELKASQNIEQKADANWTAEGGANASIKAGANFKAEGTAQAEVKGPMATVSGDATLTLKGGVVMIN